jgi:hypothetical protein
MATRATEVSPQAYARLGGVLYLVIIAIGTFGQLFVRDRLVVAGDATATAANIADHQWLWRLSVAGELTYLALGVVLAVILYTLLRPVNRSVAVLALSFNLVAIAVEVSARLHLLSALALVGDSAFLEPLGREQLHALAYLSIRMHDHGFSLSLMVFGCALLAFGDLVRRSGYLPRLIGILLQIAGGCYVVNTLALLLSPALAAKLLPFILLPPFVAELSLCLWLLVKRVDVAGWNARVAAVAAHPSAS